MAAEQNNFDTKLNEALAQRTQGDLVGAVRTLMALTTVHTNSARAFSILGRCLYELKLYEQAISATKRALVLEPDETIHLLLLGAAQHFTGDLTGSIATNERVIQIDPQNSAAHRNIGLSYAGMMNREAALRYLELATELGPDEPQNWSNLAVYQSEHALYEQAEKSARACLALEPNHAGARLTCGEIYLAKGDLERGWPLYEARFDIHPHLRLNEGVPLWNGESLAGKVIHLSAEQGLGDTLQFVRLTKLLKDQGATVMMTIPKALWQLLEPLPWIDVAVCSDDPIPERDYDALLLGLASHLHISLEDIPLSEGYIQRQPVSDAASGLIAKHRKQLNIGLIWRGNPKNGNDRLRSSRLKYFEPLAQLENVQLFSLQRDDYDQELDSSTWAERFVLLTDFIQTPHETAGVMAELDIILSVDTFMAHLGGALGLPTWVMVPFAPDWRWLLERGDSPWYQSARVFRQQAFDDWSGVVEQVIDAVHAELDS